LRQIHSLQIDPVTVLAQSHHLALWGRVLDFDPADLDQLLYRERAFFDWGGALYIYPIEDWPALQHRMQALRTSGRHAAWAAKNGPLIKRVLAEVRERGPLLKREVSGQRVDSYRGTRDSGDALHYLFLVGELMSFNRENKQRRYELSERILPEAARQAISLEQAQVRLLRKSIAQWGLAQDRQIRNQIKSHASKTMTGQNLLAQLDAMQERRELVPVRIAGNPRQYFIAPNTLPLLNQLIQGNIPKAWHSLEESNPPEAIFLSPLEYVSARGRAAEFLDFDYIWELYKPAEKRKYGPYTLPILFGDRLVARIDMKADRETSTLIVNGFWPEPYAQLEDALEHALSLAFQRCYLFCN
jgi:hypothetical protein